jgi:hypothetical protein
MKIKGIVAMLALGAALSALPSSAEARHRHSRSRHHYSTFGVRIYSNPYPVYRSYGYAADPYWNDSYNDDGSYGAWANDSPYPYYGSYRTDSAWGYDSPYPYYGSYRRVYREPVVTFGFHGGHRGYRTQRHHRGR